MSHPSGHVFAVTIGDRAGGAQRWRPARIVEICAEHGDSVVTITSADGTFVLAGHTEDVLEWISELQWKVFDAERQHTDNIRSERKEGNDSGK